MRFHSTYVGVDGERFFVVMYVRSETAGDAVRPMNVADDLTADEAYNLAAAVDAVGEQLERIERRQRAGGDPTS